MRFGYRRLTAMLVREGMSANHKRVYRLYREEGLAMRIRQRRRIRWSGVVTSPAATRTNHRWSMDFVSDCVSTGKAIRMLWTTARESARPLRSTPRWAGCECGACWIGSPVSADCRKQSLWTTGRSFAVERWPPGVKNGAFAWSSFGRASRCRMPTWRASTADCAMNA